VKVFSQVNPAYTPKSKTDSLTSPDTTKSIKSFKGKNSTAITPIKRAADTTKKTGQLQSEVKSHAEDSTIVDQEHQITYLYGKARVTYGDFELDADYIRVDQKNHLIFAKGSIDPVTKQYVGRPISKQGKEDPILSDSLLFNYKTKKGKIFNPASSQSGNYFSGGVTKKIDSTEVAIRNVLFSTCDLPYPDTHFGIVITKGIAEKNRIISGPAYLEIEGVPLPLVIPFGFFPKPDSKTSGVIIPTVGEDPKLGFYLRNFGYYIVVNDYMDLTTTGTLYSKGSYELNEEMTYRKRYKYDGNISLSYGSHNYGLEGDPPTKDFNITWSHSQNPDASPGSTFSASVNAGTSTFYQNSPAYSNFNSQALTQNNLRSTINYSRTWEGTPFNLSVGLSHSQDLSAKTVSLQLPTLSFSMASISPFESKESVAEPKWWQKITVSYSLQADNSINNLPEAQLFQGNNLIKNLQTSIVHNIPVGLSLNLFHYFQFSTNVNYTEHWYLKTIQKSFARGSISGLDSMVTDTVNGFKRAGMYNLSTSLSTKIYSEIDFKKGNLMAIRHVMTPSLSFAYNPDFSAPGFGYYKTAVSNATIPYPYASQNYSIFEDGFPSAGQQAGIGLSIDNTLQAKFKPKTTDTSGKPRKVDLLQGFTFSTFYNFAADSLNLSPISFSAHTAILNQKVNLTFFGSFNPYVNQVLDSISNGQVLKYTREINKFTWQQGRFPALTSFSFSMSGSLNSTTFNPHPPVTQGSTLQTINAQQAQRLAMINSDPGAYIDFNIPWDLSFNYSFSYNNNFVNTNVANTVMISGSVKLTDKWQIQYSTTYDLRALKLSGVPQFNIYRNLHCWDLNVQWVPFGYYKSYNVTLKVNAAILQDLKLSKRSDYTNNQNFNSY
jgi:hypothetical protein